MAIWRLYWSNGNLALDYHRPGTLGVFRAGVLQRWVDQDLVVRWILDQEVTTTGDLVLLPDGRALQVLRPPPLRV